MRLGMLVYISLAAAAAAVQFILAVEFFYRTHLFYCLNDLEPY